MSITTKSTDEKEIIIGVQEVLRLMEYTTSLVLT
jgi:hypothetical protein